MEALYLIRHGCTEANEKKLYCGSTNLPLSEAGAEDLKKIKYQVPKDCIYIVSGMKRTEQTLRYLLGDVPYKINPCFREIDFGVFEMKSYEELKNNPEYQEWISGDNEKKIPPKGESAVQMQKRVLEGLKELEKESKAVVLITHGGVIAAIMAHLFPEEEKNRYSWQPRPGHGYVIAEGKYQELKDENINETK